MNIKKIAFIEAGAAGFQMLSRFNVARVGTVLLSTMLRERGYEVRAYIEGISKIDWSFVENADLVCISTLTSTALRAYAIADRVRLRGIPVVMGGAHPSFMADEALLHCDYVVRGEGDETLFDLLGWMEKGTPDAAGIAGLSYRDRGGPIVHNEARPYLCERDLDSLPVPDFSLVQNWKSSIIYPVSTSRGCPFECRFCSVIGMFGRKYRFKSLEATMRELRHIHAVSQATRFFVDDNFTANKDRSKELLRSMIAERLTSTWAAQVRTDVAKDPELLRLMADAGCHTLYIGFESINPRTLAAFNKHQALEDIVRCVKAVKDHGLHIHGMFVLGADTDDVDVIRRTSEFANTIGIDTTQIASLTPLPGTQVFEEMEASGRLLHRDWSRYNLQHAVFRPARMAPETLQIETLRAMKRFYSWRYIFRSLARRDFHYVAVGLIGRRIVAKSMKEMGPYLGMIRESAAAAISWTPGGLPPANTATCNLPTTEEGAPRSA